MIMEYQKITNFLYNKFVQASKFSTKNWTEIKDNGRGMYNTSSQIKFDTTMLKSGLFDYNDAYKVVKGIITVAGQGADTAAIAADRNNKEVIIENYAQFTDCISEMNNTIVNNAKDLDVLMPMYNLIEDKENYLETSGSFWQYCNIT